jgi:hypothetical protein
MTDKSAGIEFDRQVFAQPPSTTMARPAARLGGLVLALAAIAVLAVVGYKLLAQSGGEASAHGDPTLADLDRRLATIEERLEKLEARKTVAAVVTKKDEPTQSKETIAAAQPAAKTVYQVSGTQRPQVRTVVVPAKGPDPATAQKLAALQQRLGALQSDSAASHDAWQAATDKLADVAGQVGSQGVEILRSQDELNQLLARTEMEAIPFELLRGSNPQPIGPVSLVLKSANPKTQRYTVCVYVQPTCIQLRDRTLNEVVQFVLSRNTTPLEIIATRMTKDEITGYLEVPRNQIAQ